LFVLKCCCRVQQKYFLTNDIRYSLVDIRYLDIMNFPYSPE